MNEIMDGAATPVQIAGFGVALRMKGETAGEVDGLAAGDAAATRRRSTVPGAAGRPGRHRRGPGAHGQHLDDGRDRRGGGRRPDGQARQPGGLVGVRRGRRARGARRGHRPAAGRRPSGWRRRPASSFCSRRSTTRRCGTPRCRAASSACRRCSTSSARWPTRPGPRRRRSAWPTRGWARCWPGCWPGAGCSALVFRGEDGLDELTTTAPSTVWVVPAARSARTAFDPGRRSGIARSRPEDLRGGDPAHNAAVARAVLAAQTGPGARRRAAERGRGAGRRGGRARPGRPAGRPGRRLRAAAALDSGPLRPAAALGGRGRLPGPLALAGAASGSPAGVEHDRVAQAGSESRARTRPRGRAASRCGTRCGSRCASRRGPCSAAGDDVAEFLVRAHPDHGDQVELAGHRVDLADLRASGRSPRAVSGMRATSALIRTIAVTTVASSELAG